MSEACPDDNELTSLVEGRLEGDGLLRLERHVDGCSNCSALLADLAAVLAPNDAAPEPRPGRYQLLGELGAGAQGVVHEAYDRQLGRRVALKRIRPDLALVSPGLVGDARLRLEREARTLAGLSHPNVVSLFDVESEGEELVLVQELVDGETLDVWLRDRPRTAVAVLDVFAQAAAGLHAAHLAGVIHRDVKPANVLVGKDGRVRVTDFGLARAGQVDTSLTQTGAAVGTPAYMAPEQLAGKAADARSDQYSLAVALAEAVTGERPLPNPTSEHLEAARREHAREGIGEDVLSALARALSARPADRFETIAVFAGRLRPPTTSSSGAALIDARTMRPPPAPASSSSSATRIGAGVAVFGLTVIAGYVAWNQRDGEPAESSALAVESTIAADATSMSSTSVLAPDASEHADTTAPGAPLPLAPTIAPSATTNDALTAARRARLDDPNACVAHHDTLTQTDPALAGHPAVQRERAECEMLAGKCDAGRQRMRGLLKGEYAGDALENTLDALTLGACKRGNVGAASSGSSSTSSSAGTSTSVSADDARALAISAHEAWKKGDVAQCRKVGAQATQLAQPGQPIETSSQLASAIGLANDCLSKNGDCANARKNFIAQYPKLYPQLVAGGVDVAQRDAMFDAAFPNCVGKR